MPTLALKHTTIGPEERGSGSALVIALLAFLILIAAGLTDYYHAQQIRNWAYNLAAEAARSGSERVDLDYYLASGLTRLLVPAAQTAATTYVHAATFPAGVTLSTLDVRVLPAPTGGSIASFPPVPRANMTGGVDWTEVRPAVGVYIELSVPSHFLGLVNGGQPVPLHVFASAVAESPP